MSASQNLRLSLVPESGRRNQRELPDRFTPELDYLWVERKQIPHLRVMGRNIRFLKSDLEPFRASFRQEMVNV